MDRKTYQIGYFSLILGVLAGIGVATVMKPAPIPSKEVAYSPKYKAGDVLFFTSATGGTSYYHIIRVLHSDYELATCDSLEQPLSDCLSWTVGFRFVDGKFTKVVQ